MKLIMKLIITFFGVMSFVISMAAVLSGNSEGGYKASVIGLLILIYAEVYT